jgi:predicted ArsR family transcriptional regulator
MLSSTLGIRAKGSCVAADAFDQQVNSVAALGEPVRRELYRYVVAQPEPVSREGAATGVGVPHHVAKFHLDKLEEDGLLEVEYRRPPGRSGPGAGRPAKLYRRSARHIVVSLPERRYDLAGYVLAEAVGAAQRSGLSMDQLISEAAYAAGAALVVEADTRSADPLSAVTEALAATGYEPRLADGRITLVNCPFDDLAASHPALVCALNLDLINGLLGTLGPAGLSARLDPSPGRCCVTVTTGPSKTTRR